MSKHNMTALNHALSRTFWRNNLADFKKSLPVGKSLFYSDFKSTYREAFLGVLWTILPTAFMIASYLMAESAQIVSTNSPGVPTFLFLTTGILTWQSFADALQAPINSLSKNKRFFLKINVPIETFLVSKIFELLLFAFIRHTLIIVVLLLNAYPLNITYAILSYVLVSFFVLLGYSLGVLLCPFGMLIQDFSKTLMYIIGFWLFCTPVFYRRVDGGALGKINSINPATTPIEQIRNSLLFPTEFEFLSMLPLVFGSFVILFVGYILLKIAKPYIYERVGM